MAAKAVVDYSRIGIERRETINSLHGPKKALDRNAVCVYFAITLSNKLQLVGSSH
jgi:hypothetical protein